MGKRFRCSIGGRGGQAALAGPVGNCRPGNVHHGVVAFEGPAGGWFIGWGGGNSGKLALKGVNLRDKHSELGRAGAEGLFITDHLAGKFLRGGVGRVLAGRGLGGLGPGPGGRVELMEEKSVGGSSLGGSTVPLDKAGAEAGSEPPARSAGWSIVIKKVNRPRRRWSLFFRRWRIIRRSLT